MKRYIITSVFLFCLLISVKHSACQEGNYNADKIIPQSPEVAAFTKYGEYPTNLTSGLVDISIPIYTIKTKSLELPISISAHLSGIKVDEVASSVGLGWSLHAGGMLSIQVQGAREDSRLGTGIKYKAPDANALSSEIDNGLQYRNKINMYCYSNDTQSDKYSYTVSGNISGTFMFDNEGKLMQIPLTDNKIEINNKFYIVTSPSGVKYYFDQALAVKTTTSGGTGGNSSYDAGYYLSKIVSADKKDSISFFYDAANPWTDYAVGFTGTRKLEFGGAPTPSYSSLKFYNYYTAYDYVLARIEFNGGEVLLNHQWDRQDKGAYRLANIQVNEKKTPTSYNCVVNCNFNNNEYFLSAGAIAKPEYTKFYKRLKLSGLEFKSCVVGELSKRYSFSYNDLQLPNYDLGENQVWRSNSYAQDLWGYYNGQTNNAHLIPFESGDQVLFRQITNNTVIPNRSVSETHAKAASLKTIAYPSGGYTVFDLESNRLHGDIFYGGLRVKRIKSYGKDHALLNSKEFEYINGYNISTSGYIANSSSYYERHSLIANPSEGTGSGGEYYPNKYWENLIYSSSPFLFQLQMSNPVYYDEIVEYQGRKEVNTGKITYKYNYMDNVVSGNPGSGDVPRRYMTQTMDRSWRRGNLLSERIFTNVNGNYIEVQRKESEYQVFKSQRSIVALVVTQGVFLSTYDLPFDFRGARNEYNWFNTYAETGVQKKVKETLSEFVDGVLTQSKSKSFHYDKIVDNVNPHQLLTAESAETSNGKLRKKYYKYPLDYTYATSSGADFLVNKQLWENNILTNPIEVFETLSYGNNADLVINGQFFKYKESGHPVSIYNLEIDKPFSYGGSSTITGTGYNVSDKYKIKSTLKYDGYNNIIELTNDQMSSTAFLWGYNASLPVARFDNTSFSVLESAMASLGLSYSYFANSLPVDMSKLTLLRSKLPNAHISLYAYHSLRGINQVVDQRALKTSYSYDGQSRLGRVFDYEENLLNDFKYNEDPTTSNLVIYTENQYFHQISTSFDVNVIQGSGNYQYQWKLISPGGAVLASASSKIFNTIPTVLGLALLECEVKDLSNNTSYKIQRALDIVSPPGLEVSEIKSNSSVFRVDGKPITFSIEETGGSFAYSYSWSLQMPTKTVTSTSKNFHVTLNEAGNMVLKCKVLDVRLQQSVEKEFRFVSQPPLPIQFTISNNSIPIYDRNIRFNTLLSEGTGSGNFSVATWTIVTPTKTVTGTGSQYIHNFNEKGSHTVKACIVDNFTGLSTCVQQVYAIKEPIVFSNVTQSSTGSSFVLTANISCSDATTVGMLLGIDRQQSNMGTNATFLINGISYSLSSGSQSINAALKKGDNAIRITYTKTPGAMGAERVSLTITSVSSLYTIGDSNKVTLNAL